MKKQSLVLLFFFILTCRSSFGQQYGLNDIPYNSIIANNTQYVNSTVNLMVVLVEFSDIKHWIPAYTVTNFTNMLFSNGIYVSPMTSPDGDTVFGSLRDYYHKMSDGNINLTGDIINESVNDIPTWITLDHSKTYYNESNPNTFILEVRSKLDALELTNGNMTSNDVLVIIYAGHTYFKDSNGGTPSGLSPKYSSGVYLTGEQFVQGAPWCAEHINNKFTNIGIHAHELGHALTLPDLYPGLNINENNGYWDLMAYGWCNGPNSRGECPAPISPLLRNNKGWVSLDHILSDDSFEANYNLQDPEVFYASDINNTRFLYEYRNFNSTMLIGATSCPDYNKYVPHGTNTGGILIWRVNNDVPYGQIIHADGLAWGTTLGNGGDLFPGNRGVRVFSPWSDTRTPQYPNFWVPNSRPTTSIGLEILTMGSTYSEIQIYTEAIIFGSPTYPKNLSVSSSRTNHPHLYWTPNSETDISGYKIYKKVTAEYGWQYLATTTSSTYDDLSETYNFNGSGTHPVWYRITALDNQSKESIPSNEIQTTVNGAYLEKSNVNQDNAVSYYALNQNYPNPFNPTTNINYQIKEKGHVSLIIYNILGKQVAVLVNSTQEQGNYSITFDAGNLPSGIYVYSLQVNDFMQNKKMLLIK